MKISAASVAFLIVAGGSSTHHASAKTVSDFTHSDNSNELGPKKMIRNGAAISVLSDAESTSMAKILELVKDLTAQVEDLKTELAAVTMSHQDGGLETLVSDIAEQVYESHHVNETVADIIADKVQKPLQTLLSDAPPALADDDVPQDGDDDVSPTPPNHLVSSGTLLTYGEWCRHSYLKWNTSMKKISSRDSKSCHTRCPSGYDLHAGMHDSQTYYSWGVIFWSKCTDPDEDNRDNACIVSGNCT